ncbi:MAG: FAD-dependent oxidoreductase [Ignavibacteriae bacterium]|nr:FAD-dependent oxidoreductase [Ignavibacteriota bacterium]
MQTSKRIIVVGGNAAGPSAAAKAKRTNPSAEVILIEAGEFISTGTCELPYLLSGTIEDYSHLVFYTPEKFYQEKNVKVLINNFVKNIDNKKNEIEVFDKKNNSTQFLKFDKLILTTGSIAKELPEIPFTLENVFCYKSVTDYIRLKTYFDKNKIEKILIVGSGYIGLEVAESLKLKKYDVTILEKEKLPLPSADIEVQHLVKEILEKNKIKLLNYGNDTKFLTKENKFHQLKNEGRFLDFDIAIVAAGIKPNNTLAETAKLKLGKFGGLVVDTKLKTSNPNIFAAGDNIEIINRITNRNDYFPLATYAHQLGHIAGENAAGGNKIAESVILNSTFKFFDKFIAQVGLNLKQANLNFHNVKVVNAVTNNKVKIMPNSSKVFGKIIFERNSNLILGASFVGNEEVSGYADIISSFIYNKIPARNLAKINYNYTPPLSPFINLLSVLGRKIEENF